MLVKPNGLFLHIANDRSQNVKNDGQSFLPSSNVPLTCVASYHTHISRLCICFQSTDNPQGSCLLKDGYSCRGR
jgi:hypothetical protein